jgi:hypothetical protein
MKTAVKPFTTIVAIPAGAGLDETASAVTLVDSAGNTLECNWVRIEPVSGGPVGEQNIYGMFMSSLSGTPGGTVNDISGTGQANIGVVGSTFNAGTMNPIEIFLGDAYRVSEVQIGVEQFDNRAKGGCDFALTYGVRVPINPLRAKDRPTGN